MEVYYCQQAADAGWEEYAFRYGLYLEEKGADGISYLKKGYDVVDDAEYTLEVGRAAYFLGNAAYRNGRTDEAKRYWKDRRKWDVGQDGWRWVTGFCVMDGIMSIGRH